MKLLKLFLSLASFSFLLAQSPDFSMLNEMQQPKISIKNAVLAKVHGKTITVLDIMKKMDYAFYRNYPDLAGSEPAKCQFYMASWKHVLNEMINTQLILADAEDKELKIEDAEVRKEMESRFGPNIMLSLDQYNLTYDEAWNMLKEEMIVQRMSWFRVNSKALQKVTPENIRSAYKNYLAINPPEKKWKYQVLTIKSHNEEIAEKKADEIYQLCSLEKKSPEDLRNQLKKNSDENLTIQLSTLYTADDSELSEKYKSILSALDASSYSKPQALKRQKTSETSYRIFYLDEISTKNAASFEEKYNEIENELLQQAMDQESKNYVSKLRKYYEYDHQKIELPHNFEPFSIEQR
ncbi:MAG: hypothetical protein COT84_06265 [Chlamydiae bacterium CG10_big_fil_rev_8_21_14_0_10_35_9]|nr:MAG: hypothetical protein COT84_06265 [Chlamydiae bacterium CG10_big_fil_rev_8_21_14_0_10_35_9]